MKISLMKKPNKNNTTSLLLVYNYGYIKNAEGKIKHKRKYKTLDIKLITSPKNAEERKINKEIMQIAGNILMSKQTENIKSDFDILPENKSSINFIDYFTSEMNKRVLENNSFLNYKIILSHLVKFCNPDTTTLKDVNENFILEFKKYLDEAELTGERKLKNNTKYIYMSIVKSILSSAYKSGLISKNPFNTLKLYKLEETEKSYLTSEEIQKLIETECPKPLVRRAFLFSCFTGLRFSDICALKWNQLITEKGEHKISYRQKKTKKLEILTLNKKALFYLGKRGNPEELIFKGLRQDYMVNSNILRWITKAGINKEITFHSSRHTFATLLLSNGVDIYTVSKLLGHRNIKTTQVYAKIINPKLSEAINKIPDFILK